ncbi:MAG TPA: SUMF1/EgtB/PvdO family nonheme iron enzyme [Herpetosiphonaceae bacterium]
MSQQYNAGTMTVIVQACDNSPEQRYLQALLNSRRHRSMGFGSSSDQRMPVVDLLHVAIPLAVDHRIEVDRGTPADLSTYLEPHDPTALRPAWHPDYALPHQALDLEAASLPGKHREVVVRRFVEVEELLAVRPRLILLGGPGSGKSTVLWMVAWQIAAARLSQVLSTTAPLLLGSLGGVLPIVIPATTFAQLLADCPAPDDPVLGGLRQWLKIQYGVDGWVLVPVGLIGGPILLLVDGLDEVAAPARPTLLAALDHCAARYPTLRLVITCRTLIWTNPLAASITAADWEVRTILPWRPGQIRHALAQWHQVWLRAGMNTAQADQTYAAVLQQLVGSEEQSPTPTVATLAETPLLCTMLVSMVLAAQQLPPDRGALYEQATRLLLDGWDAQKEQPIGMPALVPMGPATDQVRALIDRLAYEALAAAGPQDGLPSIAEGQLRDQFVATLRAQGSPQPHEDAAKCVQVLRERGGLLHPGSEGQLVFPHRTFHEYAAGRHLLLHRSLADILSLAADPAWHEPLLLGSHVLMQQGGMALDRLELVLRRLSEPGESPASPLDAAAYRGLMRAAELGEERDWKVLQHARVAVTPIQHRLRDGLQRLLADRRHPLPIQERERAGILLGHLGDPRYPTTLDDWRAAIALARSGRTNGYFCKVPAGTYWIGSDPREPESLPYEWPRRQLILPQPFWIGRYPITNAQWAALTPIPAYRQKVGQDQPNQPVHSMSWDEVAAWCQELSTAVQAPLRLPTALEWEMAARGPQGFIYPWGNTWRNDRAAICPPDQHVQHSPYAPAVGCYPAGAAPCGAQDMAGSVWEWTSTILSPAQVQAAGIPPERQFMGSVKVSLTDPDSRFCCVKGAAPMFIAPLARVASSMYWPLDTLISGSDLSFRVVLLAD